MDFQLPFNGFKMEVLKHLMVALSQLHHASWTYVKVFQYLCEYLNGGPSLTLLFNHFKVQCGPTTHTRGCGLIHLVPTVHGFGAFSENLKRFEDRFYLITSFVSRLMQHYTSSKTKWTSGVLTCSLRTRTKVIS